MAAQNLPSLPVSIATRISASRPGCSTHISNESEGGERRTAARQEVTLRDVASCLVFYSMGERTRGGRGIHVRLEEEIRDNCQGNFFALGVGVLRLWTRGWEAKI